MSARGWGDVVTRSKPRHPNVAYWIKSRTPAQLTVEHIQFLHAHNISRDEYARAWDAPSDTKVRGTSARGCSLTSPLQSSQDSASSSTGSALVTAKVREAFAVLH